MVFCLIFMAVEQQAAADSNLKKDQQDYEMKMQKFTEKLESLGAFNNDPEYMLRPQPGVNGPVVKRYRDGKIQAKLNFKNGQPQGRQQFFNTSGVLIRENNYDHGLTNGEQKYFDDQGRPMYQWTEKKGKKEGIYRGYFRDGSLASEQQYSQGLFLDKNGKPYNGIYTVNCPKGTDYPKGTVFRKEEYTNGVMSGPAVLSGCDDHLQ